MRRGTFKECQYDASPTTSTRATRARIIMLLASSIYVAFGAIVLSVHIRTLCPSVPRRRRRINCRHRGRRPHHPPAIHGRMLAFSFRCCRTVPSRRGASTSPRQCAVALAATLLSAAVGKWASCTWTGFASGGATAARLGVRGAGRSLRAQHRTTRCRYTCSSASSRLRRPSTRAPAFAIGLALCNQHTLVFFLRDAVWALLVSVSSRRSSPTAIALLAISGLLGLSIPLPHPLRVANAVWGTWGEHAACRFPHPHTPGGVRQSSTSKHAAG